MSLLWKIKGSKTHQNDEIKIKWLIAHGVNFKLKEGDAGIRCVEGKEESKVTASKAMQQII